MWGERKERKKKIYKWRRRKENAEEREKILIRNKSETYSGNVGWPNRSHAVEGLIHVMVKVFHC